MLTLLLTLACLPSPQMTPAKPIAGMRPAQPIGKPPIFGELTLDDALVKSLEGGQLVIFDATAPWCGPCKQMDATTWRDERVVGWKDARALFVQADLDADDVLRRRLKVSAYPTLIAFQNGAEVDRIVGARGADDLLAWMDLLASGTTHKKALAKRVRETRDTASWDERADRFGELVDAALDRLAADELAKLLTTSKNVSPELAADAEARTKLLAARRSRLLYQLRGPMRELALRNPRARQVVTDLRTANAPKNPTSVSVDDFRDWVELSWTLDDERFVVDWLRQLDAAGDPLAGLEPHLPRLFDPLVDHGLARVAGRLLKDPLTEARQLAKEITFFDEEPTEAQGDEPRVIPAMPMMAAPAIPNTPSGRSNVHDDRRPQTEWEQKDEIRARMREKFRQRTSKLYASLLAAGRTETAADLADFVITTADDPRTRLLLLERALDAGSIDRDRARHKRWILDLYEN